MSWVLSLGEWILIIGFRFDKALCAHRGGSLRGFIDITYRNHQRSAFCISGLMEVWVKEVDSSQFSSGSESDT